MLKTFAPLIVLYVALIVLGCAIVWLWLGNRTSKHLGELQWHRLLARR